jgi:NDP-sugar pyrophosphorylase family protein
MIIFPMAGLSSRFFEAGFNKPKFMLPLRGESVFFNVIEKFRKFFTSEVFIFTCRTEYNTPAFIRNELSKLGLSEDNFRICCLPVETRGQADTVALSLDIQKVSACEPITIFNIDTIRHDFDYPVFFEHKNVDGYLEVFIGEGTHWSFVVPVKSQQGEKLSGRAQSVVEKSRVSNLCSNGLYYFRSSELFKELFDEMVNRNLAVNNEFYIAPMYQIAIEKGLDIRFSQTSTNLLEFCGTPEEYSALYTQKPKLQTQ